MSAVRWLTLALGAVAALGCAHAPAGEATAPQDASRWIVVPHVRLVAQTGDADCGPAALEMALGRWGAVPSADAWRPREGENRTRDGFSAGTLRDEARRAGFQSYVFEGTFDDLAGEVDRGRPVVVGLIRVERGTRTAHYAVVVGHDLPRARWLLADPALGVRAVAADALRDEWARAGWVTLVVFPTETAWLVEAR